MPLPFPDYPAHAAFVAPARRRADFWRLGLGIALIAGVYIGGMNGLLVYLMARYGEIIGSAIFFRMSLADSPGADALFAMGGDAFPFFVLLDANGAVVARQSGEVDPRELETAIADALG